MTKTVDVQGADLGVTSTTGALVIYAKRQLNRHKVEVWIGEDRANRVHSQVLERKVNGRKRYVAVFPSLPPGNHKAQWPFGGLFTIYPGKITELETR